MNAYSKLFEGMCIMKLIIIKKFIGLLTTLSLLISPELIAAVTTSNQEKIILELVDQYNHEVHTFGDFQEFAKKHSEHGLSNLNINISKIDKTMKAPKLEYKNGKIQTEVLGEKLEFEAVSNNIKLSYSGKQFDLGVAKNLNFNLLGLIPRSLLRLFLVCKIADEQIYTQIAQRFSITLSFGLPS